MKKLLLLGLAVLGLFACTPSANPINDDPTEKPTEKPNPNPNNDPKKDSIFWAFKADTLFAAPRKGGIVEIPVEFEGEYEVLSSTHDLQIVRSKTMQKGTIAVSITPNLGVVDRVMGLVVRYLSKETTTTYPNGQQPSTEKKYTEKKIQITQQPVAQEVLLADITQATSLYVAASSNPSGAASKAASNAQKLYKIAATGAVDSVVFKDEYGDTATVEIQYIRNLSDKYVFMNLRIEPRNQDKYYVVRKTDGAVFAAKPPYIGKGTEVQTDHRQNIYYVSSGGLYKMYDYNNGVDIAKLTKDYMNVLSYLVDPKGNVLFEFINHISGQYGEKMCYISSGEFSRSDISPRRAFLLKKEPENFYTIKQSVGNIHYGKFVRVRSTLPTLLSETVVETLSLNGQPFYFGMDFFSESRFFQTYYMNNLTILLVEYYGNLGYEKAHILRFEDESNCKITPLSRPRLPKASKGGYKPSGDYLYGFNSDEIYRINIHTGDVEVLYANNEYSIYDFNVGADDVLTFSALELRKAQDVLCELRNGQIKVLKTEDTQKIIQLERIN